MLPYILLILLPSIIYLIGLIKKKRWDKPCLLVFFLILIVLLSLRSVKCGTDLRMYSNIFNVLSKYSFNQTLIFSIKGEMLYYILSRVVSFLGGNFQLFLAIVSIISIFPIAVYYYKNSKHGLLTIALFLIVAPFPMFFSGLRQAIAMGLVVLSFVFVEEKKPIKYIISIIIITLFHRSAIIALLFYPIYHLKITKKWLYFIIPIFALVYIFNEPIFMFLVNSFNSFYKEAYGFTTSTAQYSMLVLLLIFNVYCFAIPDKNKIDKNYIGLRNILLLSTFFQLFVPINFIVMRMNYYALLFVPIVVSNVPFIGLNKNKKLIHLSVIIMICFFFSYFIYEGIIGKNLLDIFPYIPFWEG